MNKKVQLELNWNNEWKKGVYPEGEGFLRRPVNKSHVNNIECIPWMKSAQAKLKESGPELENDCYGIQIKTFLEIIRTKSGVLGLIALWGPWLPINHERKQVTPWKESAFPAAASSQKRQSHPQSYLYDCMAQYRGRKHHIYTKIRRYRSVVHPKTCTQHFLSYAKPVFRNLAFLLSISTDTLSPRRKKISNSITYHRWQTVFVYSRVSAFIITTLGNARLSLLTAFPSKNPVSTLGFSLKPLFAPFSQQRRRCEDYPTLALMWTRGIWEPCQNIPQARNTHFYHS